jgi:D-ribose pyranose/furanose isomerase RbsD
MKEITKIRTLLKEVEKQMFINELYYTNEINKLNQLLLKINNFLEETNTNLEVLDYTEEYLKSVNDKKSKALKEYGYKLALIRFKAELEK